MKLAVLAIMLVACTPAPAEKLRAPKRKTPPVPVEAHAPKRERPVLEIPAPLLPPIDIAIVDPDPTPELRWPLALSDHPELAPRFDIAKVLAEPGLDWTQLCRMGAQRRIVPALRDQHLYLRAWCATGANDHAGAVETLAKLRTSVVPGLAAAVRVDLANLLVSSDSGARPLVAKVELAGETDLLDRVAALYADMNKLGAATEINELALANDSGVSPAKTCQRLARRVLLAPDMYRRSKTAFSTEGPSDDSGLLFGAKLGQDAKCRELDAQLSCWLVKSNCSAWYKLAASSAEDAALLDAHAAWPSGSARADDEAWFHVVRRAFAARPKKEAYVFATIALEASMRLTDCTADWAMKRVRDMMSFFVNDPAMPSELAQRITKLDEDRTKLCWMP